MQLNIIRVVEYAYCSLILTLNSLVPFCILNQAQVSIDLLTVLWLCLNCHILQMFRQLGSPQPKFSNQSSRPKR